MHSAMTINLHNRHFLKLLDFTPDEILYLLELSSSLKKAKKDGLEQPMLKGKNIALIFEKTSTRTRCAFEVAAADQGAFTTYLGPTGSQIGHKESVKDTARALGRLYDAIEYRGYGQHIVETLAQYAGVPVWNGLTDEFHPTQAMADLLTMREHSNKPLSQISFAFTGDTRNNMANSLLTVGAKMGMDVRIVGPSKLHPHDLMISECMEIAEETGARITVTDNFEDGLAGCDFVHTDVWLSMGEPVEKWEERIGLLLPYQINAQALALTGNPNCKVMHCLPAYHNRETQIGEEIFNKFGIDALEITEEIFESPNSIVFDQAENCLHTIKAVMVATLGS